MKSTLFLLLILLTSCTSTPKEPATSEPIKAENEDDLFTNLSMDLIANPRTQAEKDQNIIVSYAMDNTLAVKKTRSGIYYQIIEEGKGSHPTMNGKVKVHYEGKLLNGTVFDSSIKRGEPIEFPLGGVIKGWTEGVQLMKNGSKFQTSLNSRP